MVKKCVSKKWEVDCISTKLPSKNRKVKNARYIIADISKRKNLEKRIKSYYNFVVNLGVTSTIQIKQKLLNHIILAVKIFMKFLKLKNLEFLFKWEVV